jgi:hypothetical protein
MAHVLLTLNEPLLQRSKARGPLGLSLTTNIKNMTRVCEIKVVHEALSTGKNFLYPIPLFCTKLGTVDVLLRYFYPRKDL